MRVRPSAVVLASILGLGLFLPAAHAEGDAKAEEESQLPLQKVTLFTSGVGYFEHRATIQGDQKVTLTFDVDDVNDLLKSMVVRDEAGGRISAITYGSRDPVSKALQSFAIDLTENLTLADLFKQLRGEAVYVETPEPVQGTILSVQTRVVAIDDKPVPAEHLNILTDKGIRSIPFDAIRTVRLLDLRLDQEMRQALAILSAGRDNQKKTVTFEFTGAGARPVRVGYVQATPVWKTSYRLVLGSKGTAYLQGWAIVENTTNRDWDGVNLTLVSGAPVSFVMNLYEPLYAKRPVVQPELRPGVAPQRYERDLAELMDAAKEKSSDRQNALRRGGAGARPGAAPAPAATPAMEPAEGAAFLQGGEAQAAGAEVGELFQYVIENPVHLGRQRSAMIPIVGSDVKAEKVSIYDPAVDATHPLNGVQLDNDTALHLMQGPVTVFDGGTYAGDALLGDLPAGGKRLLTYAMDLEVEVAVESKSRPEDLLFVRIQKGVLRTTYKQRVERTYTAKNDDDKERTLLVAQPIDPDWKLISPDEPAEKTRGQYRFRVILPAKGGQALSVVQERVWAQQIAMTNLRQDLIAIYLRAPSVSDDVKKALQQAAQMNADLQEIVRQREALENQVRTIESEQNRIRQNMQAIDRASDLYARYLKKLGEQESQIEGLRNRIEALQQSEADAKKALDDFLSKLNVG